MGEFKKLNVKLYEKKQSDSSADTVYWKKYVSPVFLKEFGPIDYVDFSSREPYHFAVTSSVRIQVYNPVTRLLYKNLSRFQKNAYGGSFRCDGRLLCSGGEEASVKLFDVATKSLLRVFKGHDGPVHRCFFTVDNTKIASFSDDASVGVWDIPSEKRLFSYKDHSDYIRAGAVSPISADLILSGGYDNIVKLYDTRSGNVVFTVNHSAPVESLLFVPSGSLFLSAGGTEIRVWDALMGGRLLTKFTQHHKTVTCLRLASRGTRLLSSSLDRHVNIYDMSNFNRIHSITYPNSILSLAISPDDDTLAVGMVDGLVSVCRREVEKKPTTEKKVVRKAVIRFTSMDSKVADMQVGGEQRSKNSRYETFLRKFEHTAALASVLTTYTMNKTPHVTIAVLRELMARKELKPAMAGSDPKIVVPLLKFLIKYIGDVRFHRCLIQVTDLFLDVYEDSIAECGSTALALFKRLNDRVQEEIALNEDLLQLQGSINLLLSSVAVVSVTGSSTSTSSSMGRTTVPDNIRPSLSAKGFVVNVI